MFHDGGCLCGAIRYRIAGDARRTTVCHCTDCQRRTGGAFALLASFKDEQIAFSGDAPREFEYRSDESGRWIRAQFCARCGTNVTLMAEKFPGYRIISVGTLDDPKWLKPVRHVWTRSAQHWLVIPEDLERFEKSGT
jgi:hypothetical protein